jgi:sulfatase maturation enzyme AslB (radical SAM superfamily)
MSVTIPTNGMVKPSRNLLEILMKCKSLSIWISIDAYGKLNDYLRKNSQFDTIIDNLDFFYSLIERRPNKLTTIGVGTTVNVYNVNKLQELDNFLKNRYPNLSLDKSILHNPDYLRISCLPAEYKDKIRHTVNDYPEILKFLNIDDSEYFDEFIFYHNKVDNIRQESLEDLNLELLKFINSYTPKRTIVTENILRFFENYLK